MKKQSVRHVATPLLAALCIAWVSGAAAQNPPPPADSPTGPIERIKVHSAAIAGNLEGNSADRDVIVVLPPSYPKAKNKRYPVVYMLHGYTQTAESFNAAGNYAATWQKAEARGPEMILVIPDSKSLHGGSQYSSSVTVGDFEGFIAHDLVEYVDAHYRTVAKRGSRGLAGHSMGGYGVWRIGMKHPEVFSSLYAMSACCLSPLAVTEQVGKDMETVQAEPTLAAALAAESKLDWRTQATIAAAAAWSPAPDKPPYFLDLPFQDGKLQETVRNEWIANAALVMAPQYMAGLKSMTAIAMDVGDEDALAESNTRLHELLTRFGIQHDWEVYHGTHANRIPERVPEKVEPFFARHLASR